MELLESAEREARRLEDALERGGSMIGGSTSASGAGRGGHDDSEGDRARPREREEKDRADRTVSRARSAGGAAGGFGLLSAVKHSLSGMMDVDPEATRRANIAKTRDNISQVRFLLVSHLFERRGLRSGM